MLDKKLFQKDPKQQVRLIRNVQAVGEAGILTVVAVFIFLAGGFRLEITGFIVLLAFIWAGNIAFFITILSGFNKRFKDPSLTCEQVIWAVFVVLTTVFYIQYYRPLMMMFLPLILIFGSFKLTPKQFFVIAALIIVGYIAVILLIYRLYPDTVDPSSEGIVASVFILITVGFSLVGNEISRLRKHLRIRNVKLAEAMQKIEQMAITDELTGLFNRRHMMALLKQQKELTDRTGLGFCVCFFDLDRFKNINDNLGHQIGDIVLERFAGILGSLLRASDLVARFGGEEFILISVGTDLKGAAIAANRVRTALESLSFEDVAPALKVTLSGGVAQFRPKEQLESVLFRADEALYLAKESGRNCIKMENEI